MLVSCQSNRHIEVQGHRGCRGLLPENSIPAFKKALDLGVNTLELDLAISKDHLVVVSHEPFMNHEIALDTLGQPISEVNETSFNLYNMTYSQIKKFDCGSKIHPRFPDQKKVKVYKPLLEEVFKLAEKESNHNITYNIEIKSLPEYDTVFTPKVNEFVSLVLEVLKQNNVEQRTVLQSFDIRALEAIKAQNPTIATSLLVDENENILNKLSQLSYKPEVISPYFKLLDKTLVQSLQAEGYNIIPWTLNETDDINLMIAYGVDGIISDYPDQVIELLNVGKH
jgi:glycerophosphoryl diester phosphodiesterase